MDTLARVSSQVAELERKLSPSTLAALAKIESERLSVDDMAAAEMFTYVNKIGKRRIVKTPIFDAQQKRVIGYELSECEIDIETSLVNILARRHNGRGYNYNKNTQHQSGLPKTIAMPDSAIESIRQHVPGSQERIDAMRELYANSAEDASISAFAITDDEIADYFSTMETSKDPADFHQNAEKALTGYRVNRNHDDE